MSPVESADFDLPEEETPPPMTADQYERQRQREERPAREQKRTRENQVSPGRSLPASLEAEEYLLSTCFIDGRDVVARCREAHIEPGSFYDTKHEIVYSCIENCYDRGLPIDVMVVAEELKATKQLDAVGSYAFLTQISSKVPTTAQAGYFIEKVREQAMLRKLIRECTGAVEQCYNFSGEIDEFAAGIYQRVGKVVNGANGVGRPMPLVNFAYPTQRDPNVLLGDDDYLGRGGAMTMISYAGAGKSSLVMQMALNWGIGRPAFGLRSNGPLKVLILQGEDSPRYLGKVAASWVAANKLTKEERALVERNVLVHEVKGVQGAAFLSTAERLVKKENPDLVIINPVYLYVEGDISNSSDVKPFLLGLDQIQINAEKKFGWLVVHHTGKPAGKDAKGKRQEIDNWETMYMGIGSSFWANWPRASAMLEPRASQPDGRHYWLKFGKGWQNAGITHETTENGEKKVERVNRVPLRYSDQTIEVAGEKRPLISWEYDEDGAKEYNEKLAAARTNGQKGGRPSDFSFAGFRGALRAAAPAPDKAQGFNMLHRVANDVMAISKASFNRLLLKAVESGEMRQHGNGPMVGRYWVPDGPILRPEPTPTPQEDLNWPTEPEPPTA